MNIIYLITYSIICFALYLWASKFIFILIVLSSLINYFVFLFVWKQIIRIVSFISSKTRISFENLWNWTTEDVGIVELIQH